MLIGGSITASSTGEVPDQIATILTTTQGAKATEAARVKSHTVSHSSRVHLKAVRLRRAPLIKTHTIMKTNIVSFLIAAMLFIWLFVFTFEFWFSLLMSASALILFRRAVKYVEANKEDEHE